MYKMFLAFFIVRNIVFKKMMDGEHIVVKR